MTALLLRRLLWDGVVDREEARRALHGHVTTRRPFLRVLVEARPDLAPRVEAELGVSGSARIVPVMDIVRKLPSGLPETLLAFPIARDEVTETVRVATADPGDPDLRAELSFHLGASVELVAAPLGELLRAIETVRTALLTGRDPPPSSDPWAPMDSPPASGFRPSDRPIPLVRAHSDLPPPPNTVKGVAPQASRLPGGAPSPIVVTRPVVAIAEPIIELTRAKPLPGSAGTLLGVVPGELPSDPGPSVSDVAAIGSHSEPPPSVGRALRESLDEIAAAATADEVSKALVRGLSASAERVLILSVRGNVFEGRETNDEAGRAAVRGLVISGERSSVVLRTLQTGSYVGPIPHTVVHHSLSEALGAPTDEIAAGVVNVSGRVALVYLIAKMADPARAVHRAGQLAAAAGTALEGVVRKRRK